MSEELAAQLTAVCRARTEDAEARAEDVAVLPGHAGFSFRFTLHAGRASEPLVLRLAPPGVRVYGTADVARQARLIEALGQRGIPVPAVRWYGDEPDWFGRPYSVVELVPGSTLAQRNEHGALSAGLCRAVLEQAVEVLARLHALEPVPAARWQDEPLEPVRDVARWDRLVERSADPELVALAPALRRRLIERAPRRWRTGMFHGDFQWSNLLVDGDDLVAVLDWELAAAGPVLNDLGWLCLFSDPESWGEEYPPLPPTPPPEEVEEAYRRAWGEPLDGDVAWFRALAGYKFAAISGFNLMLHRRGKRPDPYWERLESSIPRLLRRGLEVLEGTPVVGHHNEPAGQACAPGSPGSTSVEKPSGPRRGSNVSVDEAIRELNSARRLSYGEQLARTARKTPDARALKFGDEQRTFRELDERVTRLATALAERGVGYGDRVATFMMNRLEVVETYMASCRLGAICVPINFRLVPDEVSYIARDSGSKAIVVDSELAEAAGAVRERVSDLKACLVVGDGVDAAGPGAEPYEPVLAEASDVAPIIDVPEHDPAFIMYTSGTTGRPKGAVLSHFNLLINTYNVMASIGVREPDEVFLSGLPLFHIGGLNLISPQILVGGTTVILKTGEFNAAETVELLEREEVTGCYFVPTQWQQLCGVPGVRERSFKLRRLLWGASVAPPSVLQAMAETFPGVPTYNCFGQTEMSSLTTVLTGEDAVTKMGSVGKPIVNVEARIVDDDMNDVPQGDVGEIVYRGPTVLQYYWNNPEATAEAFHGGWFHSGDLVREDEDGYMYVVDRTKDMIISGGENIYCAEVEATIDSHPKVLDVAVIGVPHERWVETPLAVIVPCAAADPPSQDEIIAWCRDRLASYKKPSRVAIIDELPRNASGKVLKFQLREEYAKEPAATFE